MRARLMGTSPSSRRRVCGWWATAVAAVPLTLAAQAPASLTLAEALIRAGEWNRTILAARSVRAIDLAAVQAAGQRPNPEVSVEAERETPHWSFGAALPIEISGKRQRRIEVAQATLAVTDAETARVIAETRSSVRRAYYAVVGAMRRTEIAQELEGLAGRARDAAQERFQSGAAPRLESLQAALALAQAQNDVTSARGEVAATRAELNALLGYPADAAPALSEALEGPAPPDLASAAPRRWPATRSCRCWLAASKKNGRASTLARAMRRPDPSVSGTLTYDAPPEFTFGWRLGFAVALPLFTTGRADVAVADATVNRAVADREARMAEINGAVAAAVARAAGAHQALERYQSDILPASLQVEQMAEESYRSGQTGIAGAAPDAADRARDPPARPAGRARLPARPCRSRTSHGNAAAMRLHSGNRRDSCSWPRRPAGVTGHAVEEIATTAAAPVKTVTLAPRTVEGIVAASGIVAAAPGADWVITAPEPARILEMPKAEGDRVREPGICWCASRFPRRRQTSPRDTPRSIRRRRGSRTPRRPPTGSALWSSTESRRRRSSRTRSRDLAEARAALGQAQAASQSAAAVQSRGRRPRPLRRRRRADAATIPATWWRRPPRTSSSGSSTRRGCRSSPPCPIPDLGRIEVGKPARFSCRGAPRAGDGRVLTRPAAVEPSGVTADVRIAFGSRHEARRRHAGPRRDRRRAAPRRARGPD